MKVLIAIDSSPASQRVLDEVAARPWPSNAAFCIVSAVEVDRFSELPALVADAKRECEQLVKAGPAKLLCARQTATTQVLTGSPRRVVSGYAQDWGADLIVERCTRAQESRHRRRNGSDRNRCGQGRS
jgi:nucleotide-binding universal stress UspA family protein